MLSTADHCSEFIAGTQPFVHALPRYLGAREKSRAYQLFMFLKILGSGTRIDPESQVPSRVPLVLSAAFAVSLNVQAARGQGEGSVLGK